jgi:HD-like signal output (HDOD) protein
MAVALAMDALSHAMPRAMRPADEEIYLAGLLHDIGFLVLEYIEPELSNQFHARLLAEGGLQDVEVEAAMLEMNHCELGALLAERWNLTATIVAVLRLHHTSGVAMEVPGQPLIAMMNLAEKLLPTFDVREELSPDITIEEWQALGVDAARVEEVEAAMRLRAKEVSAAFS